MLALIVDDSRLVRAVTANIFNELKIEYEQAENGKQALEMVNKTRYDFIILDWNMPVMDGMEFFKKAKDIISAQDTKVIFCSTENDFSKISEAVGEGASEYIMKPFNKEIMQSKLEILGLIVA
jgi:two-component system chemotaxis response regulator CheY